MADVLTLHRLRQAILVAVAASLLFASGMMVQSATADPEATPDELNGFLLETLHVDFVCSNYYTGVDRLAYSFPIIYLLGNSQTAEMGQGFCTPIERLRIMLSLNFDEYAD